MVSPSIKQLQEENEALKQRLEESEQLIEAIKAGEVDAFAIRSGNEPGIYTLQSGDYAYRLLVEEFGEGALNVTEDGLIVYTNAYFCQLLKLPYEKIIGSPIADLIDPSSISDYQQYFTESLHGHSKGEVLLSVDGGVLPVYISLTSLRPKLATVGIIVTDLSEQRRHEHDILNYQKDLEIKNEALTQSNLELASFAYIASHDLQEPLRKIEMFTSRILDSQQVFSKDTLNHFDRILDAAKRMKHLISDLLNYSRIDSPGTAFELTDLNQLVSTVRQHYAELISETQTKMDVSELPTVTVIPHQFIQLFSNLILNAIKYRRPGVTPVISISAENIFSRIPGIASYRASNQFWEIRVKDNGIGFEQQYAKKIFELFQRLHNRNSYEGTGIGLAICNKIVQNHGGFIKAEGVPGEGATFIIQIPSTPDQ